MWLVNLKFAQCYGATMTVFDVIVVGAGVEGSATAYQLIKHGGKRVLLLEQVKIKTLFQFLHNNLPYYKGWSHIYLLY